MTFDKIFDIAIEKNASDIHLVSNLPPILRIDGKLFCLNDSGLTDKIDCDLNVQEDIILPDLKDKDDKIDENDFSSPIKYVFSDTGEIIKKGLVVEKVEDDDLSLITSEKINKILKKILNENQLKKFFHHKDYDFSYEYKDFRFRVNISYEKNNLKLVARVINNKLPTLEEINMPKKVVDLLNLKQGLILLTGPTGCGKSTSLAAMINYINKNRSCNIITLEDPIEFIFKPIKSIISQRQLSVDMPTFASGLKHVLRQDPNVIMVGEMRDLETISTAITLAETGHLVLATLHTCNTYQTINRIIDIFPAHQQNQIKSQLSLTLLAVISQVLVPKKSGGRIAVRELLINNTAVANLIREQKIPQIKNVIKTHYADGMISFDRNIEELYNQGIIDENEFNNFLNSTYIRES